MVEISTYSIEDLEELTGFNPRTIAYYIQQGLLPKVGRRGRSTRYPQLFVDRLRFIQRVRELQNSGRLGSVTLPRIARVIWHLVGETDDSQVLVELSDTELQRLFDDQGIPDERVVGATDSGERVIASFGKFGPYVRQGRQTASIDAEQFNTIKLDEALELIAHETAKKERRLIKEFVDDDIQVLDGRWGPFVRQRGVSARVPKYMDPTQLSRDDCELLLEKRRAKLSPKRASMRKAKLMTALDDADKASFVEEESSEGYWSSSSSSKAQRESEFSPALDMMLYESDEASRDQEREADLKPLLDYIELQARRSASRRDRRSETWTRAPITEHVELTVQGIEPEDAELVETLAQRIRELLGLK